MPNICSPEVGLALGKSYSIQQNYRDPIVQTEQWDPKRFPHYSLATINESQTVGFKADFHSAENIARSTFSGHFLLNCSNQIQISEHISKESEREKSIARHFPLNGNPPEDLTRDALLVIYSSQRLSSKQT